MTRIISVVIAGLSLVGSAAAQTGNLDQASPYTTGANSAWFNVGASSLQWQSQIRCGWP